MTGTVRVTETTRGHRVTVVTGVTGVTEVTG